MKRIELLLEQITAGSARPDWTLFALSSNVYAALPLAASSVLTCTVEVSPDFLGGIGLPGQAARAARKT